MVMYKILLFTVYLFVLNRDYASGYPTNCPRACRCARQNIVYCNERNLTLIPYSIPSGTLVLHLQLNELENRATNDEVLGSLNKLQRLDLHHNRLTSVPKGLARTLEYVDFRCNSIKFVGKNSLKGLTSLAELHLSQNNLTNHGLSPLAFEDTQSLRVLILTDNLLTKFPENFPSSLQLLRLNKNRINYVSRKALQDLKNLSNLDLSQNALFQTGLEKFSFNALTSLRILDLSHNFFTEIPSNLPETLRELTLSHNQIEYLYSNQNNGHGSLSSIKDLNRVDLSSNNLKSVEKKALVNLKLQSVQLHDNPWMCDCHLKYLKQWLSRNVPTLSSENKFCCRSPPAFAGVTLTSIDEEALKCTARSTDHNIDVYNVTASSFVVKWTSPPSDPPYISRSIVYGALKCANCTVSGYLSSSPAHAHTIRPAISMMNSYVAKEISSSTLADTKVATIHVRKLQSNSRYAFCIYDSDQNINTVALDQCVDVKTTPQAVGNDKDTTVVFIPLWSIILWCAIFFLLLSFVVGFIVWKKCKSFPSKTPQTYSHNRTPYYPDLIYQENPRQVPSRSRTLWTRFPTNVSDRTYAECGPANSLSIPSTSRDSTAVADRESDVLLQPLENRSYSVTPANSSVSDSIASPNHRRESPHHNQFTSSAYDILHSYTPSNRQSSSVVPDRGSRRPITDSGIYI